MLGTKYWNAMAGIGWIQTRSAIESILHDHNIQLKQYMKDGTNLELGRFWLETCGTHASVNALEAIGRAGTNFTTTGWAPRKPDLLALFMNDPKNDSELMKLEPNYNPNMMGNEFPKMYPYSVFKVFGYLPQYFEFKDWKKIVDFVSSGKAVQICYINPGHFVTAIAYDELKDELIIVDPWPKNVKDGNWWEVRMNKETYNVNVKPYGIVY